MSDHGLFAINPHCSVSRVDLFDGHYCFVVDDFLLDPESARGYAVAHAGEFSFLGRYYPGPELVVPKEYIGSFDRWWKRHLCEHLGVMRGGAASMARFSIITMQAAQVQMVKRFCHQDPVDTTTRVDAIGLAGVLYLFDDPRLGGTSFFRKRNDASFDEIRQMERERRFEELAAKYPFYFQPPRYMIDSNPLFELMKAVNARFNRAVFFNRSIYHAPHLTHPELLSKEVARCRLTMNFFMDATQAPR